MDEFAGVDKAVVRAALQRADFRFVLASVEGRRFVRRVLSECGVYQTSYVSGDALAMSYKEGRRSVGLWLQQLFVDCPDQYFQLLKEGEVHDGE